MRTSVALAAVAMFALATPAFSQAAGDAGANGAAGSATGHNTPGSAGTSSPPANGMQKSGGMMGSQHAAAKNAPAGDKADDTPKSVRGDQNSQDKAK